MEEKILIKSQTNQAVKNLLKFTPRVCIVIAALISICLAIPKQVRSFRGDFWVIGWDYVFDCDNIYFFWFVLGSLCLLTAIIVGIIYLAIKNCELQITETSVKGKTLFGKEVVLPLYMISAYSTRKFLSTVAVATASGLTKFSLIENYEEIGNVLSQLINQRQRNTQATTTPSFSKSDPIEDLIKLKSLLDSGIITQEEFDAKKKQLLGL